jgi:hypothetical protein
MIMEYPKINSLYKREGHDFEKTGIKPKNKNKLIIGEYSLPEFELIKNWQVFEKIDGTNVRIIYTKTEKGDDLYFGGRTSNAQIPADLFKRLQEIFTIEKFKARFPTVKQLILFGEGYGGKIQCGGNYSNSVDFIGFDIFIDGWWLKHEDCLDIFNSFDVSMVPYLFIAMPTDDIVDYVRSQPKSTISINADYIMEGVVCRTEPLLLCRDREVLKFKLKCKDMLEKCTH